MKQKLVLLFIILLFWLNLTYASENCKDWNWIFLKDKNWNYSSIVCDNWKTLKIKGNTENSLKVVKLINWEENLLDNQIKIVYLNKFIQILQQIKKNDKINENLANYYLKNENFLQNSTWNYIKKYSISDKIQEIKKNKIESEKTTFQKTYWERLLMNWEIVSREQWGADPTYSNKNVYEKYCVSWNCWSWAESTRTKTIKENYSKTFKEEDEKNKIEITFNDWKDPYIYYPVNRIILHHTAWSYVSTKAWWINYMKSLQKYHSLNLGWWDIWYHYLIWWDWTIFEWKEWWKYVQWIHVVWHNPKTIWISLMTNWYVSKEMNESLLKLVKYLSKEYELNIDEKTIQRKWDLSWTEEHWSVIAHKELDTWKPFDPKIDMNEFRKNLKNK